MQFLDHSIRILTMDELGVPHTLQKPRVRHHGMYFDSYLDFGIINQFDHCFRLPSCM